MMLNSVHCPEGPFLSRAHLSQVKRALPVFCMPVPLCKDPTSTHVSFPSHILILLVLFGDLWTVLVLAMLAHGSLALATSPRYNDGVSVFYTSLALPTPLC